MTSDPSGISFNDMTLRIYQNRNTVGWFCDLSNSPTPDYNPRVYVTGVDSDTGAIYNRFTPDISGINIIYDPDNTNSTQATTSNMIIKRSRLNVENSSGIHLEADRSNGNIILDTVGGTTAPSGATRGISLASHEGMLLQCNNNGGATNPGVFVVGGNVWYFNTGGFNMNGRNVVGAQQMESNVYTRNTSSTISIGEVGSNSSGHYVNIREPLLIYRTSNTNGVAYLNNLGGGTFATAANGMQFHDSTNHYQVIRRNQENWAMTSPLKETYTISLGAKNYRTSTTWRRMTSGSITSRGDGLTHGHPGAIGVDLQLQTPMTSSTSDSLICSTIVAHHDVYIRNIIIRGYGHKLYYFNSTGSNQQVTFETWLVTGTEGSAGSRGSYYLTPGGSSFPAEPCPSEIHDLNNLGSNVLQLTSSTRTLFQNSTTSPSNISYPFTPSTSSISPINIDVVALNNAPFKIPKGNTYHIVMIERIVPTSSGSNPITSGALTFDEYYVSNVTTTMENVVPIKFEIYGEINYLS